MHIRRPALAVAVASAAVALSACVAEADPAEDLPEPDAEPAAVRTAEPITVLDDGEGPEACLGGVLESYPPQCGGPDVLGWDWDALDLPYEEASGVRWGTFVLEGVFDRSADTLEVTEVIDPAEVEVSDAAPSVWTTPCEEPDGGWRVTDDSRVSEADLDTAVTFASGLPSFSQVWIDQSPNPAADAEPDDDADAAEIESDMNDPMFTILNVAISDDDVEGAEAEIREHWSGMLCVSQGAATAGELEEIQSALHDARDDILYTVPNPVAGSIDVSVVFDDGTLQESFDEDYGAGVVLVRSALVPLG